MVKPAANARTEHDDRSYTETENGFGSAVLYAESPQSEMGSAFTYADSPHAPSGLNDADAVAVANGYGVVVGQKGDEAEAPPHDARGSDSFTQGFGDVTDGTALDRLEVGTPDSYAELLRSAPSDVCVCMPHYANGNVVVGQSKCVQDASRNHLTRPTIPHNCRLQRTCGLHPTHWSRTRYISSPQLSALFVAGPWRL